MTDLTDELRARADELESRHCDSLRRAAAEIERLRQTLTTAWQPMSTAPKDRRILLYCPGLAGNVASEVVIGMWKFDENRRSLGFWVSDVGRLDGGYAETGPWIEYPELKPERWAPLLDCPLP
ncbi:MAG: hypothetical protein U1E23_10255 [Reyranellaceae bacterium]